MPATLSIHEKEHLATFPPPMLILGSDANSTATMQVVPALPNFYAGGWESALSIAPRWRSNSVSTVPAQQSVESPKLSVGTCYFDKAIKTAISDVRIIVEQDELRYSPSGIFVFQARRQVLKHFTVPVPRSGLLRGKPHIVLSEIDDDE